MNSEIENQKEHENDTAWVNIDTPLSLIELKNFCGDIERLFRINPLLEFSQFKNADQVNFSLQGKNLSNAHSFDLQVQRETITDGFKLCYHQGLKRSTSFTMVTTSNGSQLTIKDDYSGTAEEERNQRLEEVDKSLENWGIAIQKYAKQWKCWKRWSCSPIWNWYMKRIWLPMKPSARRISWMIICITALEFVAFLMVFTIFWLELDNYFAM
jgi:hypothetical protein